MSPWKKLLHMLVRYVQKAIELLVRSTEGGYSSYRNRSAFALRSKGCQSGAGGGQSETSKVKSYAEGT